MSAGDLKSSCSSLVAINNGSQNPVHAENSLLCLWVFATAGLTYTHVKGPNCKDPEAMYSIKSWLNGPARNLKDNEKLSETVNTVAEWFSKQCK
jgi:hypothetical protein